MKINNKIHLAILQEVKIYKSQDEIRNRWVQHYLGSNRVYEGVKSINTRKMAKNIIKELNPNKKEIVSLISSLYQKGKSFTEMEMAGRILGEVKTIRPEITPKYLDLWLDFAKGWAEVDLMCQSNFEAKEILAKWVEWKEMLIKFRNSQNISKRRASLVLLVKAVRQSDNLKLSNLAFENIEKLKNEKEVLITKAVSWLLRSLINHHEKQVEIYIQKNRESLPRIAYRESYNKLTTGVKNQRPTWQFQS